MEHFADIRFAQVSLGEIATSLGLFLGALVLGRILRAVLGFVRDRLPERTVRHAFVDALERPAGWGIYVLGVWAAVTAFSLPTILDDGGKVLFDIGRFVTTLLVASSVALGTWFGARLVDRLSDIWWARAQKTESTFDDQLVPVVRKTAKVFLMVVGTVMVVQNLGYSVTSLVAGLGIGGAALALASKDTVANVFGAIVIFVDRPFQVGDWVEIGDLEGTVEEVGLRVTMLRTFANSLLMVPNAQLTTTAINNWSRMRKRRIKMNIGVTYDATPEQIVAGRDAILRIIEQDDRFHHDFYLVRFTDLGDSSLNYFVYCFTTSTDWAEYLAVREEFLLAVMTEFAKIGLSFAFPSQSVYVEKLPDMLPAGSGPVARPRPH